VHTPRLLTVGVDPDQPVHHPLRRQMPGGGDDPIDVVAYRSVGQRQCQDQRDDEQNARGCITHQNRSGTNRAATRNAVSTTARTRPTRFSTFTASPPPARSTTTSQTAPR